MAGGTRVDVGDATLVMKNTTVAASSADDTPRTTIRRTAGTKAGKVAAVAQQCGGRRGAQPADAESSQWRAEVVTDEFIDEKWGRPPNKEGRAAVER